MIVNKNAKSLEESVFFALEEEILSGKLKRGETLTEISLSQRLGVSRTPIRGALSRLGDEGIVEIHPNRGAVVVGIGDEELRDIYKIRIFENPLRFLNFLFFGRNRRIGHRRGTGKLHTGIPVFRCKQIIAEFFQIHIQFFAAAKPQNQHQDQRCT